MTGYVLEKAELTGGRGSHRERSRKTLQQCSSRGLINLSQQQLYLGTNCIDSQISLCPGRENILRRKWLSLAHRIHNVGKTSQYLHVSCGHAANSSRAGSPLQLHRHNIESSRIPFLTRKTVSEQLSGGQHYVPLDVSHVLVLYVHTYLFPDEFIVQLGNHAVLGFHFFLEVGHELVGVVLRLEDFGLPTPGRTQKTMWYAIRPTCADNLLPLVKRVGREGEGEGEWSRGNAASFPIV